MRSAVLALAGLGAVVLAVVAVSLVMIALSARSGMVPCADPFDAAGTVVNLWCQPPAGVTPAGVTP